MKCQVKPDLDFVLSLGAKFFLSSFGREEGQGQGELQEESHSTLAAEVAPHGSVQQERETMLSGPRAVPNKSLCRLLMMYPNRLSLLSEDGASK